MSDEQPTKTTPTVTAKDLINQLKKGKQLHDDFSKEFNELYLVSGKLMSEWKEYFQVRLPPDPTTQTLLGLDSRLIGLHQEASFLKATAQTRLIALRDRNSDMYRVRYTKLVAEYKANNLRIPAKDTLNTLAEAEMSDVKSSTIHAEIELDFWKETIADLANTRKLVENAALNLSVESKALQNQKYLDSLSRSNHNR